MNQEINSEIDPYSYAPRNLPVAEMSRAQKYERLAFTFCKLGTTGLICWTLTPPLFVLLVALVAIVLYGKALALGLRRSKCFLRRPMLIMGFWAAVAAADSVWLILFRG